MPKTSTPHTFLANRGPAGFFNLHAGASIAVEQPAAAADALSHALSMLGSQLPFTRRMAAS